MIFDFLFISLTFQLTGGFIRKFGLLALGNVVGFFFNSVFYSFNVVGMAYFGNMFQVFYAIFYPLLNMLWIVTFWSLSLAALPKPQKPKTGVEY